MGAWGHGSMHSCIASSTRLLTSCELRTVPSRMYSTLCARSLQSLLLKYITQRISTASVIQGLPCRAQSLADLGNTFKIGKAIYTNIPRLGIYG